jgi:hypothetical protein
MDLDKRVWKDMDRIYRRQPTIEGEIFNFGLRCFKILSHHLSKYRLITDDDLSEYCPVQILFRECFLPSSTELLHSRLICKIINTEVYRVQFCLFSCVGRKFVLTLIENLGLRCSYLLTVYLLKQGILTQLLIVLT